MRQLKWRQLTLRKLKWRQMKFGSGKHIKKAFSLVVIQYLIEIETIEIETIKIETIEIETIEIETFENETIGIHEEMTYTQSTLQQLTSVVRYLLSIPNSCNITFEP